MSHSQLKKRRFAVAGIALSVLLLAGCTAVSGADSSAPAPDVPANSSGGVGTPEVAPQGAKGTAGDGSGVTAQNRDIVTSGSVSLSVDDPMDAARDAEAITMRSGGRIDSRSENPKTPNQQASATLLLRIPADALSGALAELRKLGTVNFVTLKDSDVTQQTTDIDARITSLRTSVDRLLGLMTQAATTSDLVAIESALSSRQGELESLQAQRTALADQIDYATINLELHPVGTVAAAAPETFWGAVGAGWSALLAAIGGTVVAFGYVLPWLVALGVIALLALLVVRIIRRRRRGASAEA